LETSELKENINNDNDIAGSDQEETEKEDQEAYVRKRCFHILSAQMDQAMDGVQQEALVPCVSEIQDYLNAATPSLELRANQFNKNEADASSVAASSTNNKRRQLFPSASDGAELGINVQSIIDQQQEAPTSHDPLLLPVILLRGAPFSLDRKDQRKHLVQMLRKARKRSCVVEIDNNSLTLTRSTRLGSSWTGQSYRNNWMHELVLQCHAQFPVLSTGHLRRRLLKRKRKRACIFSDMLLMWAQNVTCFDEIVVFLDVSAWCQAFCLKGSTEGSSFFASKQSKDYLFSFLVVGGR